MFRQYLTMSPSVSLSYHCYNIIEKNYIAAICSIFFQDFINDDINSHILLSFRAFLGRIYLG